MSHEVPVNPATKSSDSPAGGAPLSHVSADGSARMVDVGAKPVTSRAATAEGFVRISSALAEAIQSNTVKKGSVLETARLAGILAAKRTDELIPLCHTLPLDAVDVEAALLPTEADCGTRVVRVTATVRVHSRTGAEMEALTAVTIACLTIIDMGKAVDKEMIIEGVRMLEKHGGQSGSYIAPGRHGAGHETTEQGAFK